MQKKPKASKIIVKETTMQKKPKRSIVRRIISLFKRKHKPKPLSEEQRLEEIADILAKESPVVTEAKPPIEVLKKPEKKKILPHRTLSGIVAAVIKGRITRKKPRRRKARQKIRKKKKRRPSKKAIEALKAWHEKRRHQAERIKQLEKELEEKKTPTLKVKGGIQVIYGAGEPAGPVPQSQEEIKHMMKQLELDYLRHRISADDFKKKMHSYREQLRIAVMRSRGKKIKPGKKPEIEIHPTIARAEVPIQVIRPAEPGKKPEIEIPPAPPRAEAPIQVIEPSVAPTARPTAAPTARPTAAPTAKARLPIKKPRKKAVSYEVLEPSIPSALEEKAAGKISSKKLQEMEGKINILLKRYSIPRERVVADIMHLDPERVGASFDKLVNLLEMEHEAKRDLDLEARIKSTTPLEPMASKVVKAKKKLVAKEMDIEKKEIVTPLDRLLDLVKRDGKVSLKKISKELGMKKDQVKRLCEILEDEKFVVLNYPPFGDLTVQDINYKPKKKKKDKKNKKKGDSNA